MAETPTILNNAASGAKYVFPARDYLRELHIRCSSGACDVKLDVDDTVSPMTGNAYESLTALQAKTFTVPPGDKVMIQATSASTTVKAVDLANPR